MFWEICDFQYWFDVGFSCVWCCRTDKFSLLKLCRMLLKVSFWMAEELWSLSLSRWHIYILKQIPVKDYLGFTVKHFKSLLLFHSLVQTQILHQKWCSLAPGDDSLWGKRENSNKKNSSKQAKTSQLGPKGADLCISFSSDRGGQVKLVSALLETPCIIFKEFASLFVF